MPRFCSLGQGRRIPSQLPWKGSSHATRRQVLTSRPLLQRSDSDLPGTDLRDPRPELRFLPVSAQLPPATRRAPWLRREALANQRCRFRPSLAPPPISASATGHRPREGGGRRDGGTVRPPGAEELGAWRRDCEGRERGSGLWRLPRGAPTKPI